jgi:2-methylcitrate dehydratase PrpD
VSSLAAFARFVTGAAPPAAARDRAATAVLDTIGVALAGAAQPASRSVQHVVRAEGGAGCRVWGTSFQASPGGAALANGTAAHALDFDDMCFVSLAHPSAPLVPAALAAAESAGTSGRAMLDAYVVGFEVEGRLGRVMNPRHYQRGWHCTSTLGTIGAAAAASRLYGLNADTAAHALAIAASSASGLKENFGTMTKPLHAGLAARSGVLAADLARAGLTASAQALDGPQGFLHAMDSEAAALGDALADLGRRWEIIDTGVTVKLYPSCAGTHPTLDAVLDLRRDHNLLADDIAAIDVGVDRVVPTILLYDRPATGLEGKFSMPFCVAAAIVYGRVDIGTFMPDRLSDPAIISFMPRISMRVDPSLDDGAAPALTRARVTIRMRDGRVLSADADGARGYPARPASDAELDAKFLGCARGAISSASADRALAMLRSFEQLGDVKALTELLRPH